MHVPLMGRAIHDAFDLLALSTRTPFVAATWPYTTDRSVLEAGVKPDGVIPATSAALEMTTRDLENMMN